MTLDFLSALIQKLNTKYYQNTLKTHLEVLPTLTLAPCVCLSQKELSGAAPNHVQTPAPTEVQHHTPPPPHLPHLGAAQCVAGGLVQGAGPHKVGP